MMSRLQAGLQVCGSKLAKSISRFTGVVNEWFQPPVYDDEARTAVAARSYVVGLGIAFFAAPLAALVAVLTSGATALFLHGALWLAVIGLVLVYVTTWGHETLAGILALVLGMALYVYLICREGGMYAPAILGFMLIALLAFYVRGPLWGFSTAICAVITLFGIAWLQDEGLLSALEFESVPVVRAIEYMLYFLSFGVLQIMLSKNAEHFQRIANEATFAHHNAEQRLANVIEHAPYSTLICDLTETGDDFVITAANKTVAEGGNAEPAQLVGQLLSSVLPDVRAGGYQDRLIDAAHGGAAFDIERVRFWGFKGERVLRTHAAPLGHGSVALFVRDVTDEHEQSRAMLRDALHDPLTGLTNRTLFLRVTSMTLANREDGSDSVALLFIDVDGFKSVNDTYGHAVGDTLLKMVAVRLKNAVRDGDVVARLAGDEFAVLLTDVPSPVEVAVISGRIHTTMSDEFRIGAVTVQLTVSIGGTLANTEDTDPATLLRRADHAMYEAKRGGRNRYRLL